MHLFHIFFVLHLNRFTFSFVCLGAVDTSMEREIGVYWYLFSNHCSRRCIYVERKRRGYVDGSLYSALTVCALFLFLKKESFCLVLCLTVWILFLRSFFFVLCTHCVCLVSCMRCTFYLLAHCICFTFSCVTRQGDMTIVPCIQRICLVREHIL